ncbi:MAG: thiosulfate oxidation carrier complex protein SoxZ [Campylobacterota bacterium]|nr:thiosulfate oxidation carrier complex protein SoxZ [Campylobacterota bacterium]
MGKNFKVKVKPKLKNGVVTVKAMVKHSMTTYNQAEKKTGNRENADFVTRIVGTVNDKVVIDISTSQFLSKNPIFKFQFKGDEFAKGDKLIIDCTTRLGATGSGKGKIR